MKEKSYYIVDAFLKINGDYVLNDTFLVKAEDIYKAADRALEIDRAYKAGRIEVRRLDEVEDDGDEAYWAEPGVYGVEDGVAHFSLTLGGATWQ